MKTRLLTALFAVLAIAVAAPADEQAALDKLSAAADAMAARDTPKMASALGEASSIIVQDASAAGPVAAAWADQLKTNFKDTVDSMGTIRPATPVAFDVFKARVRDLYGAIIPAAKGDFAASAEYVRKQAAQVSGHAKPKLDAAASALAGDDHTAAFTRLRAILGAALPLARASEPTPKTTEQLIAAGRQVEYAIATLDAEASISRDAGNTLKADAINEFVSDLRSLKGDFAGAVEGTEAGIELADQAEIVILRGSTDAAPSTPAPAAPAQ